MAIKDGGSAFPKYFGGNLDPDDDSEHCLGCGANIFCDEHDWDSHK